MASSLSWGPRSNVPLQLPLPSRSCWTEGFPVGEFQMPRSRTLGGTGGAPLLLGCLMAQEAEIACAESPTWAAMGKALGEELQQRQRAAESDILEHHGLIGFGVGLADELDDRSPFNISPSRRQRPSRTSGWGLDAAGFKGRHRSDRKPQPNQKSHPRKQQRPQLRLDGLEQLQKLLRSENGVCRTSCGLPEAVPRCVVVEGACQTEVFVDACAVCLDAPRAYACLPCGHRCLCKACAQMQSRSKIPRCPLCREHATLGIYQIHLEISNAALARGRSEIPQRRRVQADALARLQQVLFQNTASEVPRNGYRDVKDMACQTEDACLICNSAAPTHAPIPCGHRCLCEGCADILGVGGAARCPGCLLEAKLFCRIYV